ncbi:Fanconi anemia group D2 protein [Linderina macrospora]|uniref:Fanconi anemia group D2 protein n=1 Tax=Linderina macrospora TaxID=4868 RepID=A0ACC1JEV7_9FUNG|nr:Fanconi anemia group D2 protein [Linderina macrospora]
MLKDSPDLMLPLLETLGSLECPLNQQQECRNSVLMHMISAEPAELPVMVKYLLQSVSAENAAATIQRIRRKLDMDSVVLAMRQMGKVSEELAPDVLIFDVIATSLKSHRHLREAWLKVISSDCEEVGTQTTLDIVVLLILHEISTLSKRVESVLKAKINMVSSHPVAYTPDVVCSVVKRFPAVFAAHFSGLLSVISWLIQTSPLSSFSSQVVAAMTVAAFGGMGTFQRQEIAAELAAHVGSGNANEVDTAARIYLQLAQQYPMELRPFAVFIKGLLDYVDNLSIENMRMVFDTLGILATLNTSGGDDSMFSDLYIFVRKQLASAFPKYNRIGIVGTVSLLRQLGTKNSCAYMKEALSGGTEGGSSSQMPTVNVQALRKAVQLLEMLVDAGRHQSWAFISMTYDELAHIVETHGLHPQLMTWLHENVSSSFASMFLTNNEALSERYVLHGQPHVSLPLEEDDPTVLDILAHNKDARDLGVLEIAKRKDVEADSDGTAGSKLRGCQLACLPSLFRLIQVCEKALSDGSLAEVDALLVSGLYMLPPLDQTFRPDPLDDAAQQFVLAETSDPDINCGSAISGNALVGTTDDMRAELMAGISTWQPEIRRVMCSSLYALVNWLREIINAFADQQSPEIRSGVIQRANQLSQLESDLITLADTLSSTRHEFNPVTAGLIPDVSGATAARPGNFGALTIGKKLAGNVEPSDNAQPTTDTQYAGYQVEFDDLLLSQEDSRKFVENPMENDASTASGGSGSKKRGRKGKAFGSGADTDQLAGDFVKSPRVFLRELSMSAFDILAIDSKGQNSDVPTLTVRGLRLVLNELSLVAAAKLTKPQERRFPWAGKAPAQGSLATFSSNIASCSASDLAKRMLPLLPSLLVYLESCLLVRARVRKDIEVDGAGSCKRERVNLGVDSLEDIDVVESCIDVLLQTVATILQWDGLQGAVDGSAGSAHRSSDSILTRILGALAEHGALTDHAELADMPTDMLVRRAFDSLLALTKLTATASRATSILRMLVSVRSFAPQSETAEDVLAMDAQQRQETMDAQISELAQRILRGEWSDHADVKPADLEYIVEQHIMRSPGQTMKLAREYAVQVLGQFAVTGSAEQAMLRRATFVSYYRAVTFVLAKNMRDANFGSMNGGEILDFANMFAESWLALARLTQSIDVSIRRAVLLVALRGGLTLVDAFTKHLLPRFDSYFMMHSDQIISVVEKVQKCTRILQNICNHSKAEMDTKLQAAVPSVKRKLEYLVFEVFRIMEHNGCLDAIDMGNLKHRDVRGNVVSSQIERPREDSEDDESIGVSADEEEPVEEEEPPAPVAQSVKRRRTKQDKRAAEPATRLIKKADRIAHSKILNRRKKIAAQSRPSLSDEAEEADVAAEEADEMEVEE